jgi:hydrogenase-4 component B
MATAVFLAVSPASVTLQADGLYGVAFTSKGMHGVLTAVCCGVFLFSSIATRASIAGEPRQGRYQAIFLFMLGCANGVFLSADLLTASMLLIIFALSVCAMLFHPETEKSKATGNLFLTFVLIGGAVMIYGLIDLYAQIGLPTNEALQIASANLNARMFGDGVCILLGYAVLAGLYPLHIWMPKAYTKVPASVLPLLCGVVCSAGLFGIAMLSASLFSGSIAFATMLFVVGMATLILGAVFSLISSNLLRVLSYIALSQIGMIAVSLSIAVAEGSFSFAIGGAVMHIVNLAFGMSVLLLAGGIFLRVRGDATLNKLRGSGRGNIALGVCFVLGALTLTGTPLSAGYLSISMMHRGVTEGIASISGNFARLLPLAGWLIIGVGAFTFANMMKLFLWLFIDPPIEEDAPRVCCGKQSLAAVALPALPLLLIGFAPQRAALGIVNHILAGFGGEAVAMAFFTPDMLENAMISAIIGAAIYVAIGWWLMTNRQGFFHEITHTVTLEKHVYRPVFRALVFFGTLILRFVYSLPEWFAVACEYVLNFGTQKRTHFGQDDHFALYSKKYFRVNPIRQMLAYELLLFGLGVVVALLYLLMG